VAAGRDRPDPASAPPESFITSSRSVAETVDVVALRFEGGPITKRPFLAVRKQS